MKEQSELTDQSDGSPQKKKSRKSKVKVSFCEIDDNSDEIIGDDAYTTETVWAADEEERLCVMEFRRRDAIVSCTTAFFCFLFVYMFYIYYIM